MTDLIVPDYLGPVAPLNALDVGFATIGTVQPFSARAGIGYQDLLETLRVYVQNDLYTFLTAANPQDIWDGNVDKLLDAIATQLNTSRSDINTALTAMQAAVDADLTAKLNEIASGESAALNDSVVYQAMQVTSSQTLAFTDGRYASKSIINSLPLSALSVAGVVADGATHVAALLNTAFAANAGRTFTFPAGTYALEVPLTPGLNANSIIAHPDAIFKAVAAMEAVVDHTWAGTYTTFADLPHDKRHVGGLIDGNLLANKGLKIGGQMGFSAQDFAVQNPLHRGVYAGGAGAETLVRNARLYNTGTTNTADNVGIENAQQDATYRDVTIRDFVGGALDTASAAFANVHPWISQGARIPNSYCFSMTGSTDLVNCYADTAAQCYIVGPSAHVRIIAQRVFFNNTYYTAAIAASSPPSILTISAGGKVDMRGGIAYGHPDVTTNFVNGSTSALTVFDVDCDSHVTNYFEWKKGIQQGRSTFTPTLKGSSTAGNHTYTTASGIMNVNGREVTYIVKLIGTFDNTIAGALRIAGLPAPTGGTGWDSAVGSVGYQQNVGNIKSAITVTTDQEVRLQTQDASFNTIDVDTTTLRTKAFTIWLTLTTVAEG